MKLLAGGVRGTSVVADAEFLQFGGDTTCFLVEGEVGERIVVDAGSGLRVVERHLRQGAPSPVQFLLTHYHADHLVGFPSFSLFTKSGCDLRVAGPALSGHEPAAVFERLFEPPFWPLQPEQFKSRPKLTTLPESCEAGVSIGGLEYRWCPVCHPGGCVSYRIDEPRSGLSVVIATDLEWDLATADQKAQFLSFCRAPRPPTWLLVDGQFTPENYASFRGWGHSRWSDGVEIASLVGAGQLLVIHHAPGIRDVRLEAEELNLRKRLANASMLRQGMILTG
jgi:phosphoribosyl 1,2-cyclic phosphodiesterase